MFPFHHVFYAMPEVWGHSGIDFSQIQIARRKARRGKMYRRYRHQYTRGMKAKARS